MCDTGHGGNFERGKERLGDVHRGDAVGMTGELVAGEERPKEQMPGET